MGVSPRMVKFTCPKCDSEALTIVGYDKTLLPQLIEKNFIGVGDYYEDIIIHQCGNCGTRFLSLNHSAGGFIKEINTVTSSNKPKTFKLKTVSYKSFEELSDSDKLNAVRYALSDEVNLEDIKNFTEEQEKQKQAKKPRKRSSK